MEMNLSFFPLFLLVVVGRGVGLDECQESRCGKHGPAIRFPFRLKNRQPEHCGFPGFDLFCTETQDTLLELPTSVKLYINTIDYASQVILTSDPNNCLPRQLLNFNLLNSPFKFGERFRYDYVFFNCTSIDRKIYLSMPCLSVPGYDVHAFVTDGSVTGLALTSCTKMYNLSSVPMEFISRDNTLHLNWSRPACRFCESQDKYCRLKKNSTTLETECFDKPKSSRRIGIKLMAAGEQSTDLSICSIAILSFVILHLLTGKSAVCRYSSECLVYCSRGLCTLPRL